MSAFELASAGADGATGPTGVGVEQMAYVEFTGNVTISATTAATANDVVSAGAIAFDGSTRICIEFYTPLVVVGATAGSFIVIALWDSATDLGRIAQIQPQNNVVPICVRRYFTPSNASHTFLGKAYRSVSNGTIWGGAGGVDTPLPGYIRITKAPA